MKLLFNHPEHRVRPRYVARAGSAAAGQRGATLIEVLVAVLLLSFGIVGLAGLQMSGAKFNHSAYLRSQGTALAYDMADRIRANLDACTGAACAYSTDRATVFDGTAAQRCGLSMGAQATPAAMAAVEVNQWKHCLQDTLPDAQGAVQMPAAGTTYTDRCNVAHNGGAGVLIVEVAWTENRMRNAGVSDCVVIRTDVRP